MPNLGVIIASVREGRAGTAIADWFAAVAEAEGSFAVTTIDLADVGLPLLSEPTHPRLRKYSQPTTLAWSAQIAALDAFVFVTPEYNGGSPPALVNALDHLSAEWSCKVAGFVSYGGVSAGMRSVAMTKVILNILKVVSLPESVAIPMFTTQMEAGVFKANDGQEKAARILLTELARWDGALRSLRA